MQPAAYLHGTDRQPEVWVYFDRDAVHASSGMPLIDWVKAAPGRYWNAPHRCWVITGFGPKNPDVLLATAGFTIDRLSGAPGQGGLDESLRDVLSLADLTPPLCRQDPVVPGRVLVRPRFAGWTRTRELLGSSATWDKATGRFEVPLTDILVHGDPKPGLSINAMTVTAAREALSEVPSFGHAVHTDQQILEDAARAAFSTGVRRTADDEASLARLVEVVGDVPDWFGMDMFPYQRVGAIAVAAGRSFLADPTGLGKTTQAIAAMAIQDRQRVVVVVPPITVTHWANEIVRTGFAVLPDPKTPKRKRRRPKAGENDEGAASPSPSSAAPHTSPGSPNHQAPPSGPRVHAAKHVAGPNAASVTGERQCDQTTTSEKQRRVVVFRAARKAPDLPETGVVVVPDSLLSSRPELRAQLRAWRPDGFIYDEAHRARTWKSARAEAAREFVAGMDRDALRIAITATPLLSNPAELAAPLAISGHLDRVFGGYQAFLSTYCARNNFNALVANLDNLPQLRRLLEEKVWVRRKKEEVLADLPPKHRVSRHIDIDLTLFKRAHGEVMGRISRWVDAFVDKHGRLPDEDDVASYAHAQISLISPLRKATGVSKVPAAMEMVKSWLDENVVVHPDGTFTCDRPLVVWAHHRDVVDAMRSAAVVGLRGTEASMVRVIDGSVDSTRRGHIVAEFQQGRVPVLICSITAAGVGITLTRGSDALFLESDWTPAFVSQAEDRQYRIGQTQPVTCTTLLAAGTLDAQIQGVLLRKAAVITAVMDDADANVAVMSAAEVDDAAGAAEIIAGLVEEVLAERRAGRRRRTTAA